MRTSDEHTKLARVALDFWPDLDSAFELNVAKARVNLPAGLKVLLQPHIEQLVKQARKAYSPTATGPTQSGRDHGSQGETGRGRRTSPPPTGSQDPASRNAHIGRAIRDAASAVGEVAALERIKEALKDRAPNTASEIGW